MDFTYKVKGVDYALDVMEVVFSMSGKTDVTVGLPIPFDGDDIDEFVASYAPIGAWNAQGRNKAQVSVGFVGSAPKLPTLTIDEKRALASMTRSQFFIAVKDAGYISSEDAIMAARGEFPVSFETGLNQAVSSGLITADEADKMRIEFAGANQIDRNHSALQFMQSYFAQQGTLISDSDLDQMFGINA